MAFVRCLTAEVVSDLASDLAFSPEGWDVYRVADIHDQQSRNMTADRAVEIRESKGRACLLLVDTGLAGAGMDGIYNAAQEIQETDLFSASRKGAMEIIARRFSPRVRDNAERAIRSAKAYLDGPMLSPWKEFDFLASLAGGQGNIGELVYLIGLWPIKVDDDGDVTLEELQSSREFMDRLLGTGPSGASPGQRVEGLSLTDTEQKLVVESFLREVATKPIVTALADLSERPGLWINVIQTSRSSGEITNIKLVPWRQNRGGILAWSGLKADPIAEGDSPILYLDPKVEDNGNYSSIEIRWTPGPTGLEPRSVRYQVAIVTTSGEELASEAVEHTAKIHQQCRFTNDDFIGVDEGAVISAKAIVSVIGKDDIEPEETEDFIIRMASAGETDDGGSEGPGKTVRTFTDGLIELAERESIVTAATSGSFKFDNTGFVTTRTSDYRSYKVYRPPLMQEVEERWANEPNEIGRWRVTIRGSGDRVGDLEFIPISALDVNQSILDRVIAGSRRMSERFKWSGGVGQIYDQKASDFRSTVRRYLSAWSDLLGDSYEYALSHTVEVQNQSGGTIGLIVLPSHPIRVAWHTAYDNLVLFSRFDEGSSPKAIRDEFSALDGSNFPEFLPGIESGRSFVFADTLGFHAIGMVPDDDQEPKAAVALLSRALGARDGSDSSTMEGGQPGHVIGKEISRYSDAHPEWDVLRVHALRPGDGMTMARSLGYVHQEKHREIDEDALDRRTEDQAPAFVLELYPSEQQRGVSGRFLSDIRDKRRSGAGALSERDTWMVGSTPKPGGINIPNLKWARKDQESPETSAHLAVAFDTFESVVSLSDVPPEDRPISMYGLVSFLERTYTPNPQPTWTSLPLIPTKGQKHPSDPAHTDILTRLQRLVMNCVAENLGNADQTPRLQAVITADKAELLKDLHELCDWVVTIDRNSGIEYLDSPPRNGVEDDEGLYDSYVIDCVPEREDMGTLQLITSTTNLDEIRLLLDEALDQMGLTRSLANSQNLLRRLKALSGRLAMRLATGSSTSELIALALGQSHCRRPLKEEVAWPSLRSGFIVPVDDVMDLIPSIRRLDVTSDDGTDNAGNRHSGMRPDLIYVSVVPRGGISFRFIEVKYRGGLGNAQSLTLMERISQQTENLRTAWGRWYSSEEEAGTFRSLRRAKLARVLRFYADKAARHDLEQQHHSKILSEIDKMIERGVAYRFSDAGAPDLGWVFCPEHTDGTTKEISPAGWETRIFLFGPGPDLLADSRVNRSVRPEIQDTLSVVISDDGPDVPQSVAMRSDIEGSDDHEEPSADGETEIGEDYNAPVASQTNESTKTPDEAVSLVGGGDGTGDSGCSIEIGKDIYTESKILWNLDIKGNPHLLIAGLPGMGKTTLLLKACLEMLDSGVRPIVFSYHEDLDEKLSGLVPEVRFIDFAGLGFNPLQVIDRDSPLAYLDVAASLRDIFSAVYPELGDLQGDKIRTAIKQSFIDEDPRWGQDNVDLSDAVVPPFSRFLELLRDEATSNRDKGFKNLMARLGELDDYGFFSTTDDEQSIWESEQPTVIRIHTTQNETLQRAFASIVFYGLYKGMFQRGIQDRITHSIIFDEAHRAARMKLIPTMAKECRKYGISLVLASQETKDFNDSVFSAIANYLALRLNDADAKAFVRNVARSDQERALVDKIKQMDRYRGLYFAEGKRNPSVVSLSDISD